MLVSKDYPYLQIKVTVRNLSFSFRAFLDTGFTGHLVLPETFDAQLGKPDALVTTRLADGTEKNFPAYRGGVEIVGLGVVHMARLTLLGDECLMGQGIINRLKVTFDHGNQVVVEV
jgi:predicted aspartyl protease